MKKKKSIHKKVVKHLKGDIAGYKKEAKEDRKLIKDVKKDKKRSMKKAGAKRSDLKFDKVLKEFDQGKLKTGSGKKVKKADQAAAIAYSEARRAYKKKKK